MRKKSLIRTPASDFATSIKEDINEYNKNCGTILNWKEIHLLAMLITTRGQHNKESPTRIGDFKIDDLRIYINLLKPFVVNFNFTIDKVEFSYLYCMDLCVKAIEDDIGTIPLDTINLVKKQIRIFHSKAELSNNEKSLVASENNVLEYFPKVYSCLSKKSEDQTIYKSKKEKQLSRKKIPFKHFALLLLCKLDAITKNKKERNNFFKMYLPRFHHDDQLNFEKASMDKEVSIKYFIEEFNVLKGDKPFSHLGKDIQKTIDTCFRLQQNSDLFTFYTKGEIDYAKLESTTMKLVESFKKCIDDKHLQSIENFKKNPADFIKES